MDPWMTPIRLGQSPFVNRTFFPSLFTMSRPVSMTDFRETVGCISIRVLTTPRGFEIMTCAIPAEKDAQKVSWVCKGLFGWDCWRMDLKRPYLKYKQKKRVDERLIVLLFFLATSFNTWLIMGFSLARALALFRLHYLRIIMNGSAGTPSRDECVNQTRYWRH